MIWFFAFLSPRNDPFRNILSLLRYLLAWTSVNGVWVLCLNVRKMTPFVNIFYLFCFRAWLRHRGKKVEPLLRFCGIAHCTWLRFDSVHSLGLSCRLDLFIVIDLCWWFWFYTGLISSLSVSLVKFCFYNMYLTCEHISSSTLCDIGE